MQTYINRTEQSNDHTRIMRKIKFRNSFKNSIIQMTSENNDLESDRFKAALDEAFQRHVPIKK